MDAHSRLGRARSRLRVARYSLAAAAVGGFALFGVAARAAHPGTTSPAPTTSSASDEDEQSQRAFDFGAGSIGPSDTAPSIRSGGS